jgi:hypothetical protein
MDFTVANHGSLFLLEPRSEAGRLWVEEHIGPEATTWGAAVFVEHRYITDIVVALDADGYVVKEA